MDHDEVPHEMEISTYQLVLNVVINFLYTLVSLSDFKILSCHHVHSSLLVPEAQAGVGGM